jgi:hypothetical protein
MKKAIIITLFSIVCLSAKSQDEGSKSDLKEFYGKVKQVQFADVNLGKAGVDYVISRGTNENQDIIAIKNFINEQLRLKFILTPEQRNEAYGIANSYCDVVNVSWKVGSFDRVLGAVGSYPFEITFSFCDGKSYTYNSSINVNGYTRSMANAIKRTLEKMFPDAELQYVGEKPVMKQTDVLMNEGELKSYIDGKAQTNKIVGIYKLYSSTEAVSVDKVAIVEKDNKLYILNLENKYFKNDYSYGEIRGEISKTSSEKIYIGKYKNIMKLEEGISLTFLNEGMFEISFSSGNNKMSFIKL